MLLFLAQQAPAQQKSAKQFDNIALVNNISFSNPKYPVLRTGHAFLFRYQNDTFAVTAKNLIWYGMPPEIKSLSFDPFIKSWRMNAPGSGDDSAVVTHQLINTNPAELLGKDFNVDDDYLVFSIKENHSRVKPVEARLTPLNFGEKLFVAGWTANEKTATQQVYEFQYRKMSGRQVAISPRILPEQFAALAGAPVLDEQGQLVGIVSVNPEVAPAAGIYFAMCAVDSLLDIVKADKKE